MTISDEPSRKYATSGPTDHLRARAEHHAHEAERLLKSRFVSSHVKGHFSCDAGAVLLGQARRIVNRPVASSTIAQ